MSEATGPKPRDRDDAVESAYERHGKTVFNLCLRMTGSRADAEDLAQETFLRLLDNADRIGDAGHVRPWLLRTATNLSIGRARRDRIGRKVRDLLAFAPVQERAGATAGAELTEVEAALAKIPEGYRAVLVLHDVLGMTHREIAEVRNCGVGTAKSQLSRARVKLAALLEG